jgi:hypothetical protein
VDVAFGGDGSGIPPSRSLHRHSGRKGNVMGNPWTKKNPFMSMWLSSANSIIGSAHGKATAEIKRQAATAQADATRWSGKPAAPAPRKKRRQ